MTDFHVSVASLLSSSVRNGMGDFKSLWVLELWFSVSCCPAVCKLVWWRAEAYPLLQVLISAPSVWFCNSLLCQITAPNSKTLLIFGWWKFWPGRVCSSPESSAFVASKACWKLFSWYTQCLLPISGWVCTPSQLRNFSIHKDFWHEIALTGCVKQQKWKNRDKTDFAEKSLNRDKTDFAENSLNCHKTDLTKNAG